MSAAHYVLGCHQHWVDQQWLASHDVLAASALELLQLLRAQGLRANLDFDAVGYEKLAAQAPDVLSRLREAARSGMLEIVGTSFAQPCGAFHGGESNVRQRVLGVRTILRLLGVRPRAAWSRSFDWFPQLPQILAATGHEGAALFWPWDRSTPWLPLDPSPLVLWEGLDGTRLRALAPTALCLPAADRATFARALERESDAAAAGQALLEWAEPDGSDPQSAQTAPSFSACQAEMARRGVELRASTLSEALRALSRSAPPTRAWPAGSVYHGASLGKNGDYMPRYSRMCEEQLLAAESAAALASLFGRPYATAQPYPTWELEEAWRELCVGQHHAVHEREAACGSVGERSFERALALSSEAFLRTLEHLGRRVDAVEGSTIVFNTLGWTRDVAHQGGVVRDVPAWGYKIVDPYDADQIVEPRLGPIRMSAEDDQCILERGRFRVEIDRRRGVVSQIYSREFPEGVLRAGVGLGSFQMLREGRPERFATVHLSSEQGEEGDYAEFTFVREGRGGSKLRVTYGLSPLHDGLWLRLQAESLARPDPGVLAGLSTLIAPAIEPALYLHDHPYGLSTVDPQGTYVRRYPSAGAAREAGPHWTEPVQAPFTASSLVDVCERAPQGRGLLVVHDGSQAFQREDGGLRALLSMYDPWDEDVFDNVLEAELWFLPHGAWTHTERVRAAMECNLGSPRFEDFVPARGGGDLPASFGALAIDAPNVLATAFYRESARGGEGLARHFCSTDAPVRDPFVLRLVEFDGRPADVVVRLPGPIARAARTDLMGEVLAELEPTTARAPFGPAQMPWSALRLRLGPHEIATLYLDLELGRDSPHGATPARPVQSRRGRKS